MEFRASQLRLTPLCRDTIVKLNSVTQTTQKRALQQQAKKKSSWEPGIVCDSLAQWYCSQTKQEIFERNREGRSVSENSEEGWAWLSGVCLHVATVFYQFSKWVVEHSILAQRRGASLLSPLDVFPSFSCFWFFQCHSRSLLFVHNYRVWSIFFKDTTLIKKKTWFFSEDIYKDNST